MSRSPLTEPMEMALSLVWSLGTAAGFVMVGLLVRAECPIAQAPLANSPRSADDIPLADGTG
ncbi:hypothetical protein ME763_19260 [Streptomyces murinus]|uniref:hypothetical protein n=1 Tax=Streptomyces murinus TaxID=33900 RepID=UPI00117DE900|nr:hypothetical protein [Streptomyces murinus]WDO07616.1 hypothetical protein ME763_19260 [Streptomyces murinus]